MIRIIKMMLILALALPLKGQQEVLDTYVEMGLKNNSEMLQKRLDRDMAASRYNEALGMYLPKIDINARYSVADGGRNIDIPLGDIMNPIVNVLNADLPDANKIPLYENQSIPFLRENEHETKISLFQPIIHPAIFFNIQSQADRQKVADYAERVYARRLVFEIKAAYFNYLRAKAYSAIVAQNKKLVDEADRVNQRLFKNNMITKDILLQTQSRQYEVLGLAADADKQERLSRSWFNHLLNRPLSSPVETPSRRFANGVIVPDPGTDPAAERREEIFQVKAGIAAADHGIDAATASYFPTLIVAGDYGFQGEEYNFTDQDDYYMISGVLQWNLFNGFRDSEKREQAKIQKRQLEAQLASIRQQVALDIQNAADGVRVSRQKLTAAASQLRLAEESFKMTQKRYSNNTASYAEYLASETNLFNGRKQESMAYYEYQTALAKYEQATAAYPLKSN
jgi:outer membrane protein